jgi:uncharacterized protein YndB with AHSA1/START domain
MRSTILLLAALTLTGCATTAAQNAAASAAGTIEQAAPVKTHLQIHIAAPPNRVWQLLIDAPSWPKWADQIDSVDTTTPLAIGTRFTWKTNGTTIHSEVHLFDPQHRLSWTGTAPTARAVHVWQLDPTPTNGTTVTVDESMSGPLLTWLYSSTKLKDSDTTWLTALKQAAEKPDEPLTHNH